MTTVRSESVRLLASLVFAAVPAAAQQSLQVFPLGTEFRVNTYTTGAQSYPRIASDADGDFVVVWESSLQDGDGFGVFAQRYASNGVAAGSEFQVNTYTTSQQTVPAVTMDADGNFVVVWQDYTQDGDVTGSFGQRYASSGAPVGTEFRANEITTSLQNDPVVAADAAGNFVVVWNNPDVPFFIEGRRFGSDGQPLGGDFQIAAADPANLYYPEVASDAAGRFMVVWACQDPDDFIFDVCGRRYDNDGTPLGAEFIVNTVTQDAQYLGAVDADPRASFVVAWQSSYPDYAIHGQRYASGGNPQGTEFQVSTAPLNGRIAVAVAADGLGFVTAWENDDLDNLGVFAQRHNSNGAPVGTEFQVNSYTTDGQVYPAVAADADGDFVMVWEDDSGQDGSGAGIYAQRYTTAFEVKSQDVAANGTFGTDTGEGDGTVSGDRVETTVTSPNADTISIIERPRSQSPPPSGYGFLGQQVIIEAPSASPSTPLRIVFEIDAAAITLGQNPTTIQVYRNGTLVPACAGAVMACAGGPTMASPDPCVSNRCFQGDGDVQITVLTSAPSTWDLAAPCQTGFAKGVLLIKENVPGKETLIAKLIQGPLAQQMDFGDPLNPDGTPYRLRIYDDGGVHVGELAVERAGAADCSGGSAACWKALGGLPPSGTGYKYQDTDKTADGVFKVLLKANPSGTKILFKAKGPAPPFQTGMPAALLSTSAVTLQLHNEDAAAPSCFATTLTDIKTQELAKFKAK